MDSRTGPAITAYWERWYQSHQEGKHLRDALDGGLPFSGKGLGADSEVDAYTEVNSGVSEKQGHSTATPGQEWTLSHSQLETWKCPAHWARRYLYGVVDGQNEHGLIGNATHSAISFGFGEKRDSGLLVPSHELVAYAREKLTEGFRDTDGTFAFSRKDMTVKKALALTMGTTAALWNKVHYLTPKLIEPTWYVPIRDGFRLIIRPDLITVNNHVYDWKTEGAQIRADAPYAWSAYKADTSDQAAIYGLGMIMEFLLTEVIHHFVVVKKTPSPPPPVEYPTIVNDLRAQAIWNKVYQVSVEIEDSLHSGDFPRSDYPQEDCSFCPLKGRCPQ